MCGPVSMFCELENHLVTEGRATQLAEARALTESQRIYKYRV